MKQTGKCPKCGSPDIIAEAMAIDRGHGNLEQEISVATFRKPDALIFKGKQETTMAAWVCGRCGYIEFYADSPSAIKLPKA
jgi:predicted nucleic-acid-binding Zn-ribbon protein